MFQFLEKTINSKANLFAIHLEEIIKIDILIFTPLIYRYNDINIVGNMYLCLLL